MASISQELITQLRQRFTVVKLNGSDEVNVDCPNCPRMGMSPDGSGRSPAGHLGLNFRKNKAHCVRCSWSSKNLRLWLRRRSIEVPFSEQEMRSRDVLVDAESAADYKDQKVILPRGCFPISADDEDSWEFADSLYDKLITPEELVAANCHYAIEGKCAGYVIFPFYEDEELVYWQGRAVWPELANDPGKRKLNPRDEELPSGLGKGCWLYGVDSATSGGEIFLCEGTLDRMTLHSHVQKERGPQAYACSLQGTSLTYPTTDRHWLNSQFGKITALEPSSVCVLFDPDAHAKAQKLALELRKCGLPAYAGKCPDHRDPNELADHPHLLSSAIQPPNPSGLIELDPTKLSLRL